MIKHYGAKHWGLFIPIWFTRRIRIWDTVHDDVVFGNYRKHLIFTWKRDSLLCGGSLTEIRIRIGTQYL